MRDGECWEQQTSEQTIKETGFGLSPNGVDSFHTPNTTGLNGGSNGRKALKKRLSTPVARMWKDNGHGVSELKRNSETLAMQAGGSLNPTWVEWLMGWPLGWTDLKQLEMDKFHNVQQQHGES
jgi:DNA (cytosine-5)-methyltransferase 1